jgi:hypothetical protein
MHSFILKCYSFVGQTLTETQLIQAKDSDLESIKYLCDSSMNKGM